MLPLLPNWSLPVGFGATRRSRRSRSPGSGSVPKPEQLMLGGDMLFVEGLKWKSELPELTGAQKAIIRELRGYNSERRRKATKPHILKTYGAPSAPTEEALFLYNLRRARAAGDAGDWPMAHDHVAAARRAALRGGFIRSEEVSTLFPEKALLIPERVKPGVEAVPWAHFHLQQPLWGKPDANGMRKHRLGRGRYHAPDTPRNLLRLAAQAMSKARKTSDPVKAREFREAARAVMTYRQQRHGEDPNIGAIIDALDQKIKDA